MIGYKKNPSARIAALLGGVGAFFANFLVLLVWKGGEIAAAYADPNASTPLSETIIASVPAETPLWKVVGLLVYSTHFFTLKSGQATSPGNTFLTAGGSYLAFLVVPVLFLVLAGYLSTRYSRGDAGFVPGARIAYGYLPVILVGTLLFPPNASGYPSVYPDYFGAMIQVGIVYPVVCGGIGGLISAEVGYRRYLRKTRDEGSESTPIEE